MSKTFRSPGHAFGLTLATSALALAVALWPAGPALAQFGFSIAVDGEHVAGDRRPSEQPRATDIALDENDIQVTYDGLGGERRLAAGLVEAHASGDGALRLSFAIDTNYGQWLQAAEIRIFEANGRTPLVVLPVTGGQAQWIAPADLRGELAFVGRVYDRDGRYDETSLSPLALPDLRAAAPGGPRVLHGRDNTASRNIPVHGGVVTVRGTSIPSGADVHVLGEAVPVDGAGRFVVDRILPAGDHVVDISVAQPGGRLVTFRRDINIPDAEWFYVGLADLTVGTRWGSGSVVAAQPGEFDAIYYKGRAAFYLKGKIRGDYLLTASADTGSGPLAQMFSGMLGSDPQSVLRRIDPDQYYPVYGDDSVLVEDAPTDGKLYVRLERGASHVMWGNFRTEIGDAGMLRTQRQLFGASAHYETESVTGHGEPRAQATVYAAQPGTLPARDVLRGTGGSAYVLRRQDIVRGSEVVTVDVVNAVTGGLIESRRLRPGLDYSINYLQGLVILKEPLASVRPDPGAVQSSQPDYMNVVVNYEYTPAGDTPEDYAFGGSASTWLGDHLRLGAVGLAETDDATGESTSVVGVNARLEASPATFLEAELLRSEGAGRSDWLSIDGGFTFVQQPPVAASGEAHAFRLRGRADLSELTDGGFVGVAGATLEGRQAGFATLGQQTRHDTLSASAYVDAKFTEHLGVRLDVDHIENAAGLQRTEAGAEVRYALADDFSVTVGMVHRETRRPGGSAADTGGRTDVGARISHTPIEDLALHAFGQVTAQATPGYRRNDRVGLGADWRLSEAWSLGAEGSIGTSGPQALAMLSHTPAPGERTYLGLRVAPDARDEFFLAGRPLNGLVAGGERRLNEAASVFAENSYGLFSDEGRLNALYGVNFQPDTVWTASVTYETGHIVDDLAGDLDRHAVSGTLAYTKDGIKWTTRGELRLEDSADGSRDRGTVLGQTGVSVQTTDDWRLLAGLDALVSRSDQASILDGDYVEATLGAAYRPVDNDRLNALMRYTYLYDLPGPDQVSRHGTVLGPAQRSHIFSVDANYDLTENLTVGAKYGFRIGEQSSTRAARDFEASSAHLGVVRADLGIVTDWHVLLEGRALYQPETAMLDAGALVMLSYDINDVVRVGAGYNFGRFSDDLADLTYNDSGIFLNLATRH